MFRTNLKIAFRNILKFKTQSIISIMGLGIGLGCILQLSILVIHENSFDNFIPEKDNTYRVLQGLACQTSFPLAEAAHDEIPAIKKYFRFYQAEEIECRNRDNEIIMEQSFAFADSSIFDCLGIKLKYGVPAISNAEIAISEDMAKKHFGSTSPIGASMMFKINYEFKPLTVTGVFENFPSNSTLSPNYISHITLANSFLNKTRHLLGKYGYDADNKYNWDRFYFATYFVLSANTNPNEVSSCLQKYCANTKNEDRKKQAYFLQPVTSIYLKSNDLDGNSWTRKGNAQEMKYYIAISLFILLIATLNYVLLTRARMETRLKEFGTQKVLGAKPNTVRHQIVLESMIIVLISLIPATIVAFGNIPYISNTLGKTIGYSVFSNPTTWLIICLIVVLTGIFSGWVIGSRISRASTIVLLKGKSSTHFSKNQWSNAFLIVHFAVFIILFVGAITFNKQIKFALTNLQSIDPKNIIICELNSNELSAQFKFIENEVLKIPGVLQTAGSSVIPPFNDFLPITLHTEEKTVQFDGLIMGKGMIELLGLNVIEGESFSDFDTSKTELVFNESAAIKYKIEAGKLFNYFYVRGILKDFSAHSQHTLIQPMVILQQHPDKMRLFVIKTDGKNDKAIISTMQDLLVKTAPNNIVNIYYLTDQMNKFYSREQNQASIIESFAILAVILSIMGLFGMIMITTARKTKEIGIRKVNGAKIWEIMALLNFDFVRWVAIAFVIATPIAWYATDKWLQNFAYRTELNWWIFALAGVLVFVIAALTVSWQSWQAARRNPVEALRYE
ncbi:MAG: ABC transporter permease [Bacteroidales bacterium]|nr:MAG: ABC transporter permease [Bacteroidales bacterium]